MCGQENQRVAIFGSVHGVHTLTIAMASTVPIRHVRPSPRAQSCNVPSVLMISQPAPSSA